MILPVGDTVGIRHATLIAPDLEAAKAAYSSQLGLDVHFQGYLDGASAGLLGLPYLSGHPTAWLADQQGEPILRLVEDSRARMVEPMFHHGWLSLEVLVGDIDTLAAGLGPPFRVLGPPADLDLSPAIRASQVLGPCGELLYLTQVKEPVPPFDLPMTQAPVARPFIGVVSTADREASHAAWVALAGADGWLFDTRITVLNRALERPLDGRYPVAVVPLPGQSMVEIDEVDLPGITAAVQRRAGLHSVGLRLPMSCARAPEGWETVGRVDGDGGTRLGLRGPAGEHVELLVGRKS